MTENDKRTSYKPVKITVDVMPDEMEAYILLTPQSKIRDITVDNIMTALAARGVTFGIREQLLKSLSESFEDDTRYMVAQGKKPLEEDGRIEFHVNTESPEPVKTGQKIATITPPPAPVDGKTVTGNPVEAKPGNEVKFPHTDNIFWNKEEPNILLAGADGYLKVNETEITIKPFFDFEIPDDMMQAWVTVAPQNDVGDFTFDDFKEALKDRSIKYGLKKDVISAMFRENTFGKKVLIAEGTEVVHGKNGRIDYAFETEIKAKRDDQGNVDYKELNIIQNFKAGEKLLELIPPVAGKPGKTVTGIEITPKEGREAVMPSAKNALVDPENDKVLLAEIDGHVTKKGNTVEVTPVLTVKGDVDFSTGNIDFIGSVYINGEVKSGFTVKARDDIQINGFVEDAEIIAGGDIELKSGFGGKGDGLLNAGGKVLAKFCENQTVRSGEDIIFCEYLMHCTVETKGKLVVNEKKGLICGGEVYAFKGVEANIIGSKTFTPTKIFAGKDRLAEERAQQLHEKKKKNKTILKKIERAKQLILASRLIKTELSPENEKLLKKLFGVKKQMNTELEEIDKKLEECVPDRIEAEKARIVAYEAIFPRSTIIILDQMYDVQEALAKACFLYSANGVLAKDLDDLQE